MKSILVAFFSHSGATKKAAEQIHAIAGGGIYAIKKQEAYPRNYNAVAEQAKHEIANSKIDNRNLPDEKKICFCIFLLDKNIKILDNFA